MTETQAQAPVPALVITADDDVIGTVQGDEGAYLRVRRDDATPPIVWIDKRFVDRLEHGNILLKVVRDALHDGIITLPPSAQREFSTVAGLSILDRWAHSS